MDEALIATALLRLDSADGLSESAHRLVTAAVQPDVDLERVVGGEDISSDGRSTAPGAGARVAPRCYVESIEVEGFRGIAARAVLDLKPGPGLTLVVGRNGSGKSSFADALEVVLTGDSFRWTGKGSKVWRDGWRNVHHADSRKIGVRILAEGEPGSIELARRWASGDELDSASTTVTMGDGQLASVADLGWGDAITAYRPLLSYSELGSMLEDGPSKLYDALASILGLRDLVGASERLAVYRKALMGAEKQAKDGAKQLLADLADLDDERARTCFAALKTRSWDLDTIESVSTGGEESLDPHGALERARALADLAGPDVDRAIEFASALRVAVDAVDQNQSTDAERARRTADLLDRALAHHDHEGDEACPVCGGRTLDASWEAETRTEMARLRDEAASAIRARDGLSQAIDDVRSLIAVPGLLRDDSADLPVEASAAREAARALVEDVPDDARDLATHVEQRVPALAKHIEELRSRARVWWDDHQDVWRPHATALAAWLPDARRALEAKAVVADVKSAETWLTDTTNELRAERFAPIAAQARSLWDAMRGQSNVSLDALELAGSTTRRRVDLSVSVDGTNGHGVAVMSQGELNALALSLFVPRATLDASPFGFLAIDDPVQSMDPARVDGLARVLAEVATQRQVIVFTHDDRLPEACRRLNLDARVLEVQRRPNSAVEVTEAFDPVRKYLQEANFLLRLKLPPHIAALVIPSLCRQAIEAAAIDVVRTRWIRAGRNHDDIEARLDGLETIGLLSYVLLDAKQPPSDAYDAVEQAWGEDNAKLVSTVNTAAHNGHDGDLALLVERAGKLARRIQRQS